MILIIDFGSQVTQLTARRVGDQCLLRNNSLDGYILNTLSLTEANAVILSGTRLIRTKAESDDFKKSSS